MTEAEWLACTDPQEMLDLLKGRASERSLRLFACGMLPSGMGPPAGRSPQGGGRNHRRGCLTVWFQ